MGKDKPLELTYEFNNKFIKTLSLSKVRSSTKSNYIGKYNYKNSTLVELLDISKDEMINKEKDTVEVAVELKNEIAATLIDVEKNYKVNVNREDNRIILNQNTS